MHKDLAAEIERNPSADVRTQQSSLEDWKLSFNTERPHEALDMKTPAALYAPSTERYNGQSPEIVYPDAFHVRSVNGSGHIKFGGNSRFLSHALASWPVGLEIHEQELNIWFADLCLGVTNLQLSTPLLGTTPQ